MFTNLCIDIRSQNGYHGNEDSGYAETQMSKSSKQALAELLIYVQSSLQMGYIPQTDTAYLLMLCYLYSMPNGP